MSTERQHNRRKMFKVQKSKKKMHKNKSNRKSRKNGRIKKGSNNKNSFHDFEKYWDEMTKWHNNSKKLKVNRNALDKKKYTTRKDYNRARLKVPTFDIQLDVLMHKKMFNMPSNNLKKYNYVYPDNDPDLDEIKQETYILKEINLKTYNEKTFIKHKREEDIAELKAALQANIWFGMFQDEESDDEESDDEKIVDRFLRSENNSYHFVFTNDYDRQIDVITSSERFRLYNGYRGFDLKIKKLLNIARKCVGIIFDDADVIKDNNYCHDQFTFDDKNMSSKYRFLSNLLPLSFKISQVLYEYLPAMDIIKNVFIPMIGYDEMYYVTINTKIRSPQRNKINHIKTSTRVDSHDNDIAASYSILYSQLIAMGFDGEISLEAAKKYPDNVNDAIGWITELQVCKTKKLLAPITKYNYDVNWEAIALYQKGGRYMRVPGGNGVSRIYYSSSDDSSRDF